MNYKLVKSCLVLLMLSTKICLIAQEKFKHNIVVGDIKRHIEVLASDSMQGRESGKIGQQKAAHYIASQFELANLKSVNQANFPEKYFQSLNLYGRTNAQVLIKYADDDKPRKQHRRIKIQIGDHVSLPGTLSNNVDFLYYGKDEKRIIQQMKICSALNENMVVEKTTDSTLALMIYCENYNQIFNKVKQYRETTQVNSYFAIVPSKIYRQYRKDYVTSWMLQPPSKQKNVYYSFGFGSMGFTELKGSFDSIMDFIHNNNNVRLFIGKKRVVDELFDKRLKRAIKTKKPLCASVEISSNFNAYPQFLPTENVIGFIEGDGSSDEVVVVVAHYDHIGFNSTGVFSGADDNASGTAAVIEIAKALADASKQGIKPKRNIVFIAFTAEEKGLLGSEYYNLSPWFPLHKTYAVLNMDMIGRFNKKNKQQNYAYILMKGEKKKSFKQLAKNIDGSKQNFYLDCHPGFLQKIAFTFGSDHYSFRKRDISTIVLTSGFRHPDYHTIRDKADKIDFVNTTSIAQFALEMVWKLANQ